jgi:hypothetical protein
LADDLADDLPSVATRACCENDYLNAEIFSPSKLAARLYCGCNRARARVRNIKATAGLRQTLRELTNEEFHTLAGGFYGAGLFLKFLPPPPLLYDGWRSMKG